MKIFTSSLLLIAIALTGCSSTTSNNRNSETPELMPANEHFDEKLTLVMDQLLSVPRFKYQTNAVAFTTLVWMDTLTYKSEQGAASALGHQISSSLKTEFVQRGGKVVEHKSGQVISMSPDASYYLTRQLKELSDNIDVNYVLAGTMLEIQGGVEINIEVIDVTSHIVVSGARTFISNQYLPERSAVVLKDGKINREQL